MAAEARTTRQAISIVEQLIPEHRRSNQFDDRKVAVPISRSEDLVIPATNAAAARSALRELPDDVANAAGCPAGWRELPLGKMLQAWGWAVWEQPSGRVAISGIYGDVVFTECFASLSAVASLMTGGPMVFTSDAQGEATPPLFFVTPASTGLRIGKAERTVSYELEY